MLVYLFMGQSKEFLRLIVGVNGKSGKSCVLVGAGGGWGGRGMSLATLCLST